MGINISISNEVVEKYPNLLFGFSLADCSIGYSSNEEKTDAEKKVIDKIISRHSTIEELEGHYLNQCYQDFYRSMGLKVKKVSTPIQQALRVVRNHSYKSVYRIIDTCMEIEYTYLISFQVYDFSKITGNLEFRISKGEEVLTNFHGEDKTCKQGELILVDEEAPLHSVYYGNNLTKSVGPESRIALIRIMGIPGAKIDDFTQAVNDYKIATENEVLILSKDLQIIQL